MVRIKIRIILHSNLNYKNMSKTKKRDFTANDEEWEMARQKSLIKFGFVNRSGYIRQLIVNDETYSDGFDKLDEFKKYKK